MNAREQLDALDSEADRLQNLVDRVDATRSFFAAELQRAEVAGDEFVSPHVAATGNDAANRLRRVIAVIDGTAPLTDRSVELSILANTVDGGSFTYWLTALAARAELATVEAKQEALYIELAGGAPAA